MLGCRLYAIFTEDHAEFPGSLRDSTQRSTRNIFRMQKIHAQIPLPSTGRPDVSDVSLPPVCKVFTVYYMRYSYGIKATPTCRCTDEQPEYQRKKIFQSSTNSAEETHILAKHLRKDDI